MDEPGNKAEKMRLCHRLALAGLGIVIWVVGLVLLMWWIMRRGIGTV